MLGQTWEGKKADDADEAWEALVRFAAASETAGCRRVALLEQLAVSAGPRMPGAGSAAEKGVLALGQVPHIENALRPVSVYGSTHDVKNKVEAHVKDEATKIFRPLQQVHRRALQPPAGQPCESYSAPPSSPSSRTWSWWAGAPCKKALRLERLRTGSGHFARCSAYVENTAGELETCDRRRPARGRGPAGVRRVSGQTKSMQCLTVPSKVKTSVVCIVKA